jgi:ribose transport system permease protein
MAELNSGALTESKVQTRYRGFIAGFKNYAAILVGLIVLCIVIATQSPIFLTSENIFNVLRQISSNLYLSCAITIVLICGGIDLSGGELLAFTTILAATLLGANFGVVPTLIICLLCGALIGFINGMIISRTNITPFIVTLSMSYILKGLSYVYTNAQSVVIGNRSWLDLGTGFLGPVPYPVIYALVVVIGVSIILKRTKLGRHIFAIGGNETAAKFSGINVKNVRLFVYIFSGLMSALAGIVLSARAYSGRATYGSGAALDAIAAVVLGGVSMAGGRGSVIGTVIGTLIIGVINNGLNLMGIHSFWQMVVKGLIILVAVSVDYIRSQRTIKK